MVVAGLVNKGTSSSHSSQSNRVVLNLWFSKDQHVSLIVVSRLKQEKTYLVERNQRMYMNSSKQNAFLKTLSSVMEQLKGQVTCCGQLS